MDLNCQYCHQTKKLINAHIVAKGLLGNLDEKKLKQVSSQAPHTKRIYAGCTDKEILCAKCDGDIGVFDDYAKEILIDKILTFKVPSQPLYEIPSSKIDYPKFKKFFISLLWRASISKEAMCSHVSLGPYNHIALGILKNEIELDDDIFSIFLVRTSSLYNLKDVIIFLPVKIAGKKAYKINFSNYQVLIFPKSSDMKWLPNTKEAPSKLFFKRSKTLYLLEVDEDILGNDEIIMKIYNSHQRLNQMFDQAQINHPTPIPKKTPQKVKAI